MKARIRYTWIQHLLDCEVENGSAVEALLVVPAAEVPIPEPVNMLDVVAPLGEAADVMFCPLVLCVIPSMKGRVVAVSATEDTEVGSCDGTKMSPVVMVPSEVVSDMPLLVFVVRSDERCFVNTVKIVSCMTCLGNKHVFNNRKQRK